MVQSVSPALPHLTSVCSHGAIFLSCLELSSFGVSGACQDTWIYNAPHIIEIISYNSIVNPAHSGLFLKSSMKTQVSYESKEVVARIGWRLLQSEAWRVIATNHPLESGRTMPWHDIMSLWCLRLFLIETKNGSPLDSIYPTSAQFYDCTIPRSTTAAWIAKRLRVAPPQKALKEQLAEMTRTRFTDDSGGGHKFPVEKCCRWFGSMSGWYRFKRMYNMLGDCSPSVWTVKVALKSMLARHSHCGLDHMSCMTTKKVSPHIGKWIIIYSILMSTMSN